VEDAPQGEAAVEEPAAEAGEAQAEEETVAEGDAAPVASVRTSAVSARHSAVSVIEVEPEVKELVADVLTRTAELSIEVRLPSRHWPRPAPHAWHTAPGPGRVCSAPWSPPVDEVDKTEALCVRSGGVVARSGSLPRVFALACL